MAQQFTKKEKNQMRKSFKKSVKLSNIDDIELHLDYLLEYDDINHSFKYKKYHDSLSPVIQELLNMRKKMNMLAEMNASVYEIFEKRLVLRIKPEMNDFINHRFAVIRKELIKQSKTNFDSKRNKPAPKQKHRMN